jgi:hypothetical protein
VILHQHDLTLRPITGPDELDLFNSLPYVLNDEVGDDLAAGRRRPEWLWLALRGDRVVARAGWWSRAGDRHPLVMDIFDIDDGTDDGVQLLKTALAAVVPADATPPEYSRFLPADWRGDQHTRQWYRHIGAMAIFTTSLPPARACSQLRTYRGSGPRPTSVTHQWRRPSPGRLRHLRAPDRHDLAMITQRWTRATCTDQSLPGGRGVRLDA